MPYTRVVKPTMERSKPRISKRFFSSYVLIVLVFLLASTQDQESQDDCENPMGY